MKKRMHFIVTSLLAVLLSVSLILNGSLLRNSERYEQALDNALAETVSRYRIDSAHQAVNQMLVEGKIVSEDRQFARFHADRFQTLSETHRLLTLLYAPLYDFVQYEKISSLSETNLFQLFVDGAELFRQLERHYRHAILEEQGNYVLPLDAVDPDVVESLGILAEMTGDLAAILEESYAGRTADSTEALRAYLIDSANYYHREETREKLQPFMATLRRLLSESRAE